MNYEDKLIELVLNDSNIMVLTAENRASIRNLPNIVGDQFFDTGINEQSLVGISAGLALRGRVPIVHALAAFLTMRSFEFVRTDIGYPKLNAKLVGNFPGFLSEANGPTHQAIEDIALMRSIPSMNIFCPADADDLLKGMEKIIKLKEPFYIRYNDLQPEISHSEYEFGKAEVFGNSEDIAILVYGTLFGEAYKAKEILESRNISVRLINLRTLRPLDELEIINSIQSCKSVVLIEDHFKIGGLNSIVSEIIVREKLSTDLLSLSLEDKFFKPLKFKDLLYYEGFTAEQIADKIIGNFQQNKRVFNVEWSNV